MVGYLESLLVEVSTVLQGKRRHSASIPWLLSGRHTSAQKFTKCVKEGKGSGFPMLLTGGAKV